MAKAPNEPQGEPDNVRSSTRRICSTSRAHSASRTLLQQPKASRERDSHSRYQQDDYEVYSVSVPDTAIIHERNSSRQTAKSRDLFPFGGA